ncbi:MULTISPECIES: tetratricopeptide repeat protein [Chitinophagaceae]
MNTKSSTPSKNNNSGNEVQNNTSANKTGEAYANLQQAILKFNALLNDAPYNNSTTTATRDRVQRILNSNNVTEQGKLNEVNTGIKQLERLIENQKRADAYATSSSNTSAQSSTYNHTTTQQNDLTEYNRSKTDLERQMQEENARRQQEAARRAEAERQRKIQQQQQFNNAFNSAQNSLTSGDYNGAMQNYANAAQNATSKGARNIAAVGVAMSGTFGILDAVAKEKEAKRKKEEQEKRERERQQQERERQQQAEQQAENEAMEAQWKIANGWANLESSEGYQKAIEIMLPYATDKKLNGMALNSIGFWYWKQEDHTNAMKWYTEADKEGFATATRNIGVLYDNGSGVKQNKGLAMYYYQKACKAGLEDGCKDFELTRNILEAQVKYAEELRKVNPADTQLNQLIGNMYLLGESYYKEKNYPQAVRYYTLLHSISPTPNWYNAKKIADIYYDKEQLNNRDSAAIWYATTIGLMENDATNKKYIGDPKTGFDDQYTTLLFRYAGYVRKTNGNAAIDIYQKAVRDGYTGAYREIGVIYEQGEGNVNQDWKQAAAYYEKDAAKNSAQAMFYLGQLYEKGGPNLEKSRHESKKWYKLACKRDKKYCK